MSNLTIAHCEVVTKIKGGGEMARRFMLGSNKCKIRCDVLASSAEESIPDPPKKCLSANCWPIPSLVICTKRLSAQGLHSLALARGSPLLQGPTLCLILTLYVALAYWVPDSCFFKHIVHVMDHEAIIGVAYG